MIPPEERRRLEGIAYGAGHSQSDAADARRRLELLARAADSTHAEASPAQGSGQLDARPGTGLEVAAAPREHDGSVPANTEDSDATAHHPRGRAIGVVGGGAALLLLGFWAATALPHSPEEPGATPGAVISEPVGDLAAAEGWFTSLPGDDDVVPRRPFFDVLDLEGDTVRFIMETRTGMRVYVAKNSEGELCMVGVNQNLGSGSSDCADEERFTLDGLYAGDGGTNIFWDGRGFSSLPVPKFGE